MYGTNSNTRNYESSFVSTFFQGEEKDGVGYGYPSSGIRYNSASEKFQLGTESNKHKTLLFIVTKSRSTYDDVSESEELFSTGYRSQSGPKWLEDHYQKLYNYERDSEGKSASVYMTTLMYYEIRSKGVSFLNEFFQKLDLKKLSRWSLIALLRSTNVYKHKIPLWKATYLFTYELVEREGLCPKQRLYGLDRGLDLKDGR